MSTFSMSAASIPGLTATPSFDGKRLVLHLKGSAELGARELLVQVLGALHQEAVKLEVPEVVVNVRELSFMNSSCFKSFVTWLNDVQGLPAAKQYKVSFQSSNAIRWQRASLHALSCFAVDLVTIDAAA